MIAAPGAASAAKKPVQPKAGDVYTGGTANGGRVTLEIKRIWDPGNSRVYLAPYITWTRVKATCDIFDGTVFVPTAKRITARFAVASWEGRVTKGRFREAPLYAGVQQSLFEGVFRRGEVTGTVHKMTTRGTDVNLGYGCSWGPLTFDLAKNN